MTDIVIIATSVVAGSNSDREYGTAGEALTAGQVVYKDTLTGKYKLADTDSATAAVRAPRGIALNGAAPNQPVGVLTKGDITIGAALTAGDPYFLSGTAGGICPLADVAAGDYPCLLGLASSTSVLKVDIQYSGVVKA